MDLERGDTRAGEGIAEHRCDDALLEVFHSAERLGQRTCQTRFLHDSGAVIVEEATLVRMLDKAFRGVKHFEQCIVTAMFSDAFASARVTTLKVLWLHLLASETRYEVTP